jgi:hypothetical protein
MIAEITWRSSVKVDSIQHLDSVLDSISREVSPNQPQAIHIARRNGDCLTIVLGDARGCVLSFIGESRDPPYFVSLGDPTAEGIVTYFVAINHHSEALAQHVVSERDARKSVREFVTLASGLPSCVAWTEI